jgi:hypothetical protein
MAAAPRRAADATCSVSHTPSPLGRVGHRPRYGWSASPTPSNGPTCGTPGRDGRNGAHCHRSSVRDGQVRARARARSERGAREVTVDRTGRHDTCMTRGTPSPDTKAPRAVHEEHAQHAAPSEQRDVSRAMQVATPIAARLGWRNRARTQGATRSGAETRPVQGRRERRAYNVRERPRTPTADAYRRRITTGSGRRPCWPAPSGRCPPCACTRCPAG